MKNNEFKIIAKTFAGLEELLAEEIRNLGATEVEVLNRAVSFAGDKEMLYKANFCLRLTTKIYKPIRHFQAANADEVYDVVKSMQWDQYMDNTTTFLVDAVVYSEDFRHSKFVAYRVKDAIVDYWREKTGKRPNIGFTNPDLRISIHISGNDVTVSLDSSGESLHQRGYRQKTVAAPINEVLAAGIIMHTGWKGECDLIDPMCGSGTICIEAALIAMNIYPGVFRKEYAFEKWKDFDAELFQKIYDDDSQEREFTHKIYGYDINHQAVAISTENAKAAGVSGVVSFTQRDFMDFTQPEEKAIMVTNPPYGERITTDNILELYAGIGRTLKHSFVGGDAWIITYHEECFDKIGFRPSTKIALYNGPLPCELRKYQVFEGSYKERRQEGMDIKSSEDRERNLKFKGRKKEDKESGKDGSRSRDREERKRDEEPQLTRHNFKWGDRKTARNEDGDDRRDDRRADKRQRREEQGDAKKRRPRVKIGKNLGFDSEGRPFALNKD